MKKIIYILIATILTIGTIGPVLNMHFCGGKLISYSFYKKPHKCCKGNCKSCKNVSHVYKVKGDFVKQAIVLNPPIISKLEMVFTEIHTAFLTQFNEQQIENGVSPPILSYSPSSLNSILRI